MSILTLPLATTEPSDDSYGAGYFDGELDAIAKLPSALAHARAAMADPHDPDWAQGYIDGYQTQIQATHTLAQEASR